MPAPRKLLNIKSMLERIVRLSEAAQSDLKPNDSATPQMPPTYHYELVSIALLARAALDKQAKSRKDFTL